MSYLLIFLAAWGVSFGLTPLARRISVRWGLLARPGGRRQHSGLVPKLGGIPLLAGFLAGALLTYWLLPPAGDDALRLRGVVIGLLVMAIGGILDDWLDLSPAWQFLIQFAGAGIAMAHIIFIEVFTNPLPGSAFWEYGPLGLLFQIEGELIWLWRPVALLITLLWVVGMVNTVNWLDGLDGLAAGVGTIAVLLFAWHSYRLDQEAVAAFPLAVAGALLGFLPFNFSPARIFLGSAGAYFLGYSLATLAILSPAKIATALLVLAIPILDGVVRVVDRLLQGRSPLAGDRGHLHFRLADRGTPTRLIVLGYYGVALLFGFVAIFAPGPLKLVIFLIFGLIVVIFLLQFGQNR